MILRKFKSISQLVSKAFGSYKRHISILTGLGFVRGLTDVIGITALIPVFSFIIGEDGQSTDFVNQMIREFFTYLDIEFRLKYLVFFVLSLFVLKFFVVVISHAIAAHITSSYEEKTRVSLYRHILHASWPYMLNQKIGFFEDTLMNDVRFSRALLQKLSGIIMICTSLIMYLFAAINISVEITGLTVGLGVAFLLVLAPFVNMSRRVGYETSKANKEVAHLVNEFTIGAKTFKTYDASEACFKRGKEHFYNLRKLRVKTQLLKKVSGALAQPVSAFFLVAIFAYAYRQPDFNIAEFTVVVFLIQRMFEYINQLQNALHVVNGTAPYVRHILKVLDESSVDGERKGGEKDVSFNTSLSFEDVSFTYNADRESSEVLNSLNLDVKKGEYLGIVGPSGGGKTTIVDIFLRLLEPTSGTIKLDRAEISSFDLKSWRNFVGYVSQDNFLHNGTIAENIRFFSDDIDDSDLVRAAKEANILDFINSCPDGFDTQVGDRGLRVSAGQRQRIALARALARRPSILLLDEATSALDGESEKSIQEVLERLRGDITIIVIAHRLQTVLTCDRIAVLKDGQISEIGSPDDLLANNESYFSRLNMLRR